MNARFSNQQQKISYCFKSIIIFSLSQLINWTTYASKWEVTNGADTGSGSLRKTMSLINSGDTIIISNIDTILLTSGQINIDKNFTLFGESAVIKRKNGPETDTFRIFCINDPINIYLEKLTIMNGIGPNIQDRENEPFNGGGGMYINNSSATIKMFRCSFIDNTTKDDEYLINRVSSGGYGGALFIENGNVNMDSCYFLNNSTGDGDVGLSFGGNGGMGGAIYNYSGNLIIQNSRFENNLTGEGSNEKGGSGGNGGAISKLFGTLKISNTEFINNHTGNGGSGSIEPFEFGTIHYRSGQGGHGGAIYIQGGDNNIDNCKLLNNFTGSGGNGVNGASGGYGGSGGAILHYGGSLDLTHCNFMNNKTGDGGNSGIIENAHCGGGSGGAVFSAYANIFISNCIFDSNSTGNGGNSKINGSGGAFFLGSSTYDDFLLLNSLFNNNKTTYSEGSTEGGFGGAIYLNSWEGKIFNSTLSNNYSVNNGGGLYIAYRSDIKNSIIAFNKSQNSKSDIYTNSGGFSNLTYCLVSDQSNNGPGNTYFQNCLSENADPIFNDTLINDYTLSPLSPCIDKGDPDFDTTIFLINKDLASNLRVCNIIDIGSYEYISEDCNGYPTNLLSFNTENPIINVYPNPTNGIIEIGFLENQKYRIEINNSYGETLFSDYCFKNTCIDLTKYPDGVYFIIMIGENNFQHVKKIIKY